MRFTRRDCLAMLGASLALGAAHRPAEADDWPSRPIRLIVPWPPGGGADAVGRVVADGLRTQLGQSVVLENLAGAGGNIGTQQFIRQAADGYTLLLATSSTNSANPWLYRKTGFDAIKDFRPVAEVCVIPSLLVVPTASPFRLPADIVKAARAQPDKLSYASGGVGNSAHLAGALFKSVAGIEVVHVPYRGSAPALADVMGGQVDYMFDTGAWGLLQGGKIRALAVAAAQRHPLLPDLPTFEEAGIKGMQMDAWYGVAAPAGTSGAIVDRISAAVLKAFDDPALKERLAGLGAQLQLKGPEAFAAFWSTELKRYEGLVELTGAKLE